MSNATSSPRHHILQVNRSIVSAIKSLASKNISGPTIKYKSRENIHYIRAEEKSFSGVLQGVLEYAGKLAGEEGKINITHTKLKGKRYTDKSDLVKFCVHVIGRGVSEELIATIDGELKRMNRALSESGNGSPTKKFDIAFSKTYFHEAGGNVWIESNLNKGIRIYFTYPLLREVMLFDMERPKIKIVQTSCTVNYLQHS